jgi:uncharacterized protein
MINLSFERPSRARLLGTLSRAAALAMLIAAGCARDPRLAIIAGDGSNRVTVRVEIADTNNKRELGLMFRRHLDEDAAMLFVFPGAAKQVFWMKNTYIPLDMVFADGGARIVGIVANAEPRSEAQLTVDAPAQYVLEVNAGFCSRHGVVTGDRLTFIGVEPRARD